MSKFTPTREQLELLAKVARPEYRIALEDSDILLYSPCHSQRILWQPHKDRNQIAMIQEGMSKKQEDDYNGNLTCLFIDEKKMDSDWHSMLWSQKLPAHISCEQILKVLEG